MFRTFSNNVLISESTTTLPEPKISCSLLEGQNGPYWFSSKQPEDQITILFIQCEAVIKSYKNC